ncbi:MAG: radical SAM protein, partial [Syntrophaceae bacterium]
MNGGIITNYACTSRCGHCLYGCSPNREKDYLEEEVLDAIVKTLERLACRSVHIGGGEPFIDVGSLLRTVSGIRTRGLDIEYVETNAMWYRDPESAVDLLLKLKDAGLATLLISMSPFHNGFIPFAKVKGVMQACRRAGMRIFPWIMDFYDDIDSFDDTCTHSLQEYVDAFGPHYLRDILVRYWIHMGGRAVATYADILGAYTAGQIVRISGGPCAELAGASHFHIDLYGHYLPGLCSGLAI